MRFTTQSVEEEIIKPGNIDFWGDIKYEVLKYLPYESRKTQLAAEVQSLPTPELLIRLLDWRQRLVHPHRRLVLKSKEFSANPLYAANQQAIDALLFKIASGESIIPHLSESIRVGYHPRDPIKPLKHNPSLDLMLNEWGMHHLHISSKLGLKGFTERADEILIVMFCLNGAFIVDVATHKDWSDQRLVEIVYRNWPEQNFFVELKGALGPETVTTPEERARLRRAGLTTLIVVDGKVLMAAGGGLSTAGTSTRSSLRAMHILSRLSEYERSPDTLVADFLNTAIYSNVSWPEVGNFHFRLLITDTAYCEGIVETTTNKMLLLA